jgi:hypothetical protein
LQSKVRVDARGFASMGRGHDEAPGGDRRSCRYAPTGGLTPCRPVIARDMPCRPEAALRFRCRRRRCSLRTPTPFFRASARPRASVPTCGPIARRRGLQPRLASRRSHPGAGTVFRISRARPSEVPECGHASCRCARDLIPASAAPSPLAADPLPASGLACDATVRRPIGAPGRPPCDGAVPAGHLPPVQRRDIRVERHGRWGGEIGEPGKGGDTPVYRRRCGLPRRNPTGGGARTVEGGGRSPDGHDELAYRHHEQEAERDAPCGPSVTGSGTRRPVGRSNHATQLRRTPATGRERWKKTY